jgi:PKD repeat protein
LNGATIQQESWNFGNGFVANGSTAQHNYPSVGLQHYTYNALSNQGCSTVVNGTVTVHQNPTAVFNAQGACQGSGIVFNNLSSGNIASYQWNFGDGNVSNLAAPTHTYLNAGTYLPTLQIATAFGCQSSYSQVINITPGPVSTFTNTQMGGLTRLFTPSNIIAGAQYLWNFGDGTLSNDVTPIKTFNTAATYQVCLNLASQGCETYYCENITIKNLVGIDGQELSSGLMVYPNPFSDLIQVELNLMENSPVSFGFYDLAGRLMFTRNFTAGGAGARQFSLPMNSSELPNGVYVLSIEAGAQKWIERVVKMND